MRCLFSLRALALGVAIIAATDATCAIEPEPSPRPPSPPGILPADSTIVLRALTTLADQQQVAHATLERLRKQSAASQLEAARSAARLEQLEAKLVEQRDAQIAALRDAQHQTLVTLRVACWVAVMLVLAGLVLAVLILRVFRQLAAAFGQSMAVRPSATEPPKGLAAAVQELEKRVRELESATALPSTPAEEGGAAEIRPPPVSELKEIQTLIARGKAKLAGGEPQEAIDCFDAVLRFDATNVEALVRQGRALEAVGRTAEAVENYERALAADATLAAAFLGKGDVVHLLEQVEPARGRA